MGAPRRAIRAISTYLAQGDRPAQEDHLLASREKGIFVVADGFGGPVAGALASRTACEAVKGFLDKEAGDLEATLPFVLRSYFSLAGNVLFNALIHANRKVRAQNKGKNVHEKGGASVVAAFLDQELLALANVGACGAWLIREGRGAELLMPRTFTRLCDPFASEAVEGFQAPLMAVGMYEDLEPEIVEYRMRAGDWVLLHTDGLSGKARERLAELQQKQLSPESAVELAAKIIKEYSGLDNSAAALIVF